MKVICIDNFNRDSVADTLVKENVTKEEGNKIVSKQNNLMTDYSSDFYVLKEDDYELYIPEY